MAKFTFGNIPAESLQTRTKQPTTLPKPPEIKTERSIDDQFRRRLEEMVSTAKLEKEDQSGVGLVVGTVGHERVLITTDVSPVIRVESQRLSEARRLVQDSKFREALKPLTEILKESATHPEALYLMGLALFRLKEIDSALEALKPLVSSRLESELEAKVRVLRSEMRRSLLPSLLIELLTGNGSGNLDAATRRVDRVVNLDPEFGTAHCLLVHTLLVEGKLGEAGRAAERAEQHCRGTDLDVLHGLRQQIDQLDVERVLESARAFYRQLQYPKARKAMESLRSTYGSRPLWIAFYDYLTELGGGWFSKGKMPADVEPSGPAEVIEKMYFFLVREEISESKVGLRNGEFDLAETRIRTALVLAPHFPYLNFLLGSCLYGAVFYSFTAGDAPSISEVKEHLAEARVYAELGTADPEITEAPDLIESIDNALAMMAEIERELQRMERENALFAPFAEELRAVRQLADGGIGSRRQVEEMQRRHTALQRKIREALPRVSSEQLKKSLEALEQTVRSDLSQLDGIAEVLPLQEEFDSIFSGIEGGIKSPEEYHRVRGRLQELQKKLRNARVSNEENKKTLAELRSAVDGSIDNLNKMADDVADAQVTNPLTGKFESLMNGVSGGIRSREELGRFSKGMLGLGLEIARAKQQLKTKQGRTSLEGLDEAVTKILKQIQDQMS